MFLPYSLRYKTTTHFQCRRARHHRSTSTNYNDSRFTEKHPSSIEKKKNNVIISAFIAFHPYFSRLFRLRPSFLLLPSHCYHFFLSIFDFLCITTSKNTVYEIISDFVFNSILSKKKKITMYYIRDSYPSPHHLPTLTN
jgi:hypothetical protein